MIEFAERLSQVLEARGMSQRSICTKAGIAQSTLSKYTQPECTPTNYESLRKLAETLNVSSDYLLGITNSEVPIPDMPMDVQLIINAYKKMTKDDRDLLWALLWKYIAPVDREFLPISITQKS